MPVVSRMTSPIIYFFKSPFSHEVHGLCVTVFKPLSQNLKRSHALGAYKLTLSHKFTVRDILKV